MGGVLDIIASGKLNGQSFLDSQEQQARIAQEQALTQHTLQQAQVGKAQVVKSGLENQILQRDLADQDILRRALMNTDQTVPAMRDYAIKNGVSVPGLLKWQGGMLDISTKAANLKKDERDYEIKTNGEVQDILTSIADKPEAYPDVYPRLAALAPKGTFPEPGALPQDPAAAKESIAHMLAISGAYKKLLEKAEGEQKIALGEAQIGEAKATTAKTQQATKEAKIRDAVQALSSAATPNEYMQKLARLDTDVAKEMPPVSQVFDSAGKPIPAGMAMLRARGMMPEQQVQSEQAAARMKHEETVAAETARHNLSTESTARLNAAVAAGRLKMEQTVNGLKYGPGTTEYWVKQLQENPDSIKEMPPELRSVVGKGFTASTGLPLPTALPAATQAQETAARNALDGANFIRQALQNPEIRANIGPIMGRLGNAEQTLGTALHLSPAASQLAQELRTRMRYFVFQEGKAVLGVRLPAQLMKELEASSPNPKMDPAMLSGALNGAVGNAESVLENADKQRFGGKARPASMRNMGVQGPKVGDTKQYGGRTYAFDGNEWVAK